MNEQPLAFIFSWETGPVNTLSKLHFLIIEPLDFLYNSHKKYMFYSDSQIVPRDDGNNLKNDQEWKKKKKEEYVKKIRSVFFHSIIPFQINQEWYC